MDDDTRPAGAPDTSLAVPAVPVVPAVTGAEQLQALAHPLRLRLLALLRLEGPSTATRLAQRCGESSGLTSYHLRQLATAGFVVAAEPSDLVGRAVHGRDRWWRAASLTTRSGPQEPGDEAAGAAAGDYHRAVAELYAERTRAWLLAEHTWPDPWPALSTIGDVMLALTPQEAERLRAELGELLGRYRRHDPATPAGTGGVPENAVVVSVQHQLFPAPEQDPPARTPLS